MSQSAHQHFKLGFLLFDYFPFGGLQRDCLAVAQLCATRGHDVTVFTRTWEGERPEGVDIELFGRSGFSNPARNRHWIRQLSGALPPRNLDAVVGFNKLPGLDVYYGADPCYVAKVNALKPAWYRWLPRYRHFAALERAVFARGQRTELLVLTPRDIPQYEQVYGTEHERFHVLPPNATRRSFTAGQQAATRLKLRQARGWSDDEQLVLFVGSDFRRKGLERAIRSFAAVAHASEASRQFVVIGNCSPGRFRALARSLGVADRVHFLGGRHDVPDWMLAADVLLHPAHVETAGIVLLEALTLGLPVVVTSICGYAFHIERAGAGAVLPEPFVQNDCDRALHDALTPERSLAWRASALHYTATEDLYSCHTRVADIIEEVAERRQQAGRTSH